MKVSLINLIFLALSFFLLSCQTTKVTKTKPAAPTFSVYTGKTDPLTCNVQGDMEACRVDWTVSAGILTHRQVCSSKNRKYIKPMLKAMARTLNDSCALKIKYARLTTKDDPKEENRLAKMMTQSKLWRKYSQANHNLSGAGTKTNSKLNSFPEKFIKKVVSVKGVFSEVTDALNMYGYDFVLDKVEITKLNPITESRHFQTLKQIQTSRDFMVPENIRIVWLNRDFNSSQNIRNRGVKNSDGLTDKLPTRTRVN